MFQGIPFSKAFSYLLVISGVFSGGLSVLGLPVSKSVNSTLKKEESKQKETKEKKVRTPEEIKKEQEEYEKNFLKSYCIGEEYNYTFENRAYNCTKGFDGNKDLIT